MSTHQTNLTSQVDVGQDGHERTLDTAGLEHIFKWASEVIAEDGEDARVRQAREKRIRKQVVEIVEKAREDKVLTDAQNEISYLQRRVIALLTKMQEVIEENSLIKQIMLTQLYSLQQIPLLERELKELKSIQCEKDSAVTERRYLMDGLTKLKIERDYLEGVLVTAESENSRLAKLLKSTQENQPTAKAPKWWHALFSWR